jgi:hypothetical protein
MRIQQLTTYRLDGLEFPTLKAAREHVENEIGRILDAIPLRLPAKDALAVHRAVITNRARLCDLLSVEIDGEQDGEPPRNLLDL